MRKLINIDGVPYTPAKEVTEFIEGAMQWASDALVNLRANDASVERIERAEMLFDAFEGLRDDWNESVALSLTIGVEYEIHDEH